MAHAHLELGIASPFLVSIFPDSYITLFAELELHLAREGRWKRSKRPDRSGFQLLNPNLISVFS